MDTERGRSNAASFGNECYISYGFLHLPLSYFSASDQVAESSADSLQFDAEYRSPELERFAVCIGDRAGKPFSDL